MLVQCYCDYNKVCHTLQPRGHHEKYFNLFIMYGCIMAYIQPQLIKR